MKSKGKKAKAKGKKWWTELLEGLGVGLGQLLLAIVLTGMVLYLVLHALVPFR